MQRPPFFGGRFCFCCMKKNRKSDWVAPAVLQNGLVIASHGRHCVVETDDGQRVICHPRGKKSQAVAGDRVLWQPSQDEGCIERIEPRRNLLYRQDEMRAKSFAANIDQALILLAAEPVFSEHQLTHAAKIGRASCRERV